MTCLLAFPLTYLASLGPPAQAQYRGGGGYPGSGGSYSVTYNGGTPAYTGDGGYTNPPNPSPRAGNPYEYEATAWVGQDEGTASCTGSVTATLTWDGGSGGDLPPPAVIVEEDCTAWWSSEYPEDGYPYASGTADCGLPGAQVSYSSTGDSSTGVRWTVYNNPSTPLALPSVSPFVEASYGGEPQTRYLGSQVDYTVKPSLVTITITGLTNGDLLTGQQAKATLNVPGGYTVDTNPGPAYQWSSSSSTLFKDYIPTLPSGQLVGFSDSDKQGVSFLFYDRKAETLTLTCAVTLIAPDGKTKIPVSFTSQPITVVKPTASWGITSGIVQKYANSLGLYNSSPPTVTDGQSWHDVVITVLAPFSGGTFCFAQLATLSTKDHGTVPAGSTAPTDVQLKNDGLQGLDNQFPYDHGGDPVNGYSLSQPPNTQIDGDGPLIAEPPTPNVRNADGSAAPTGTTWTSEITNQSFTTYLMYKPSSPNAVWVPLQKYSWSWNGSYTFVKPDDPLESSYWSATPGNPTTSSTPTASDTDDPPQWSYVHSNTETYVTSPNPP